MTTEDLVIRKQVDTITMDESIIMDDGCHAIEVAHHLSQLEADRMIRRLWKAIDPKRLEVSQ